MDFTADSTHPFGMAGAGSLQTDDSLGLITAALTFPDGRVGTMTLTFCYSHSATTHCYATGTLAIAPAQG